MFRSSWWCPDMTLLRRKPSMPENPTITPTSAFGHRYADILGTAEDGRLRIDYGRFHETLRDRLSHPCHAQDFLRDVHRGVLNK